MDTVSAVMKLVREIDESASEPPDDSCPQCGASWPRTRSALVVLASEIDVFGVVSHPMTPSHATAERHAALVCAAAIFSAARSRQCAAPRP